MRLLTHSQMQTAKTCLRKHYLHYVKRIRPAQKPKYFRVGEAWHVMMDAYCRCSGDRLEAGILALREFTGRAVNDDKYYEAAMLEALYSIYCWRWSEEQVEYVASEQVFEVPLLHVTTGKPSRTWALAGKIDGIARLADGRLAIVEHKTCSEDISPASDYWPRLRIDSQISQYYLAALALGYDVETVIYDVVSKPQHKPGSVPVLDEGGLKQVVDMRTGERVRNGNGTWKQSIGDKNTQAMLTRSESPDEYGDRVFEAVKAEPDKYFQRQEIVRLPYDLEEYRYEVWEMGKIIRDCERFGRWPRNTQACKGFGKCVYFDICTGCWDVNDPDFTRALPDGFVVSDVVHEELSDEVNNVSV